MSRLWSLFWLAISIVAFLSFLLLSFAYRDYSHLLLAQTCFTFLGLVLPTYFLNKHYQPHSNLKHWFVSKSEETGKLSHIWIEEEEEELDLAGKFGIND